MNMYGNAGMTSRHVTSLGSLPTLHPQTFGLPASLTLRKPHFPGDFYPEPRYGGGGVSGLESPLVGPAMTPAPRFVPSPSPVPRSVSRGSSQSDERGFSSGIGLSESSGSRRASSCSSGSSRVHSDVIERVDTPQQLTVRDVTHKNAIEEELTCPVCLDLFVDPILLPCAHNLCAACVDQMTSSNVRAFHCPTCREVVAMGNLRRNISLHNIAEGYRRSAMTSHSDHVDSGEETCASIVSIHSDDVINKRRLRHNDAVLCQYCDESDPRVAAKACVTCRAYYCERCLRATHPRKKPFVNHRLVPAAPGSAGTLSPGRTTCANHAKDFGDFFCTNCDVILCKMCAVQSEHAKHRVEPVRDWMRKKQVEFEDHVTSLNKQKIELRRTADRLAEVCSEIETSAKVQEAKLQNECDVMIRIIRERRDSIAAKIKDNEASKLRKLMQRSSQIEDCVKLFEVAIARSIVTSQERNLDCFVEDAKTATEQIDYAYSESNRVAAASRDVVTSGFYLDFAEERIVLERLDILEAPSQPRVCEELCTQSHDSITVQWRSPDPRHNDHYELQYAVDNNDVTSPATEEWMIVPNIKESYYTVQGLQTGTRYVFAVKASNKAGSSTSESVGIKTLGLPFSFDPHSMHRKLRIANHGYTVSREKSKDQTLYDVTGDVAIDSGRHYWEVVVSQSTSFSVGVTYASLPKLERNGKNLKWSICRSNRDWSVRHNGKDIPLIMTSIPKKIGAMLDFDCGSVSFFDGASGRHIHSFLVGGFPRPLKPSFALGSGSLTVNTGVTVPDHLQYGDVTN